jgi:hypothetical protein
MDKFKTMSVGTVYPLYVAKVERKGQSRADLDTVIRWLTGYTQMELDAMVDAGATFEEFFAGATLNPNADLITGVICGVRVEEIGDPLIRKVRYLDKLVDELSKGKSMEKILRSS